MYSCNKITTTQIQISRQNWNGFYSNLSHLTDSNIVSRAKSKWYKPKKSRNWQWNSQLLTVQILTNDVQVLILCLSYFITTVNILRAGHALRQITMFLPLFISWLEKFTVYVYIKVTWWKKLLCINSSTYSKFDFSQQKNWESGFCFGFWKGDNRVPHCKTLAQLISSNSKTEEESS
jgi:hypothetical protein